MVDLVSEICVPGTLVRAIRTKEVTKLLTASCECQQNHLTDLIGRGIITSDTSRKDHKRS